jgi:hypothetical protein
VRAGDPPQLSGSLADKLGRAGERSFVGRGTERELVAAALTADEPTFAVLFLHGPGGVGKTALLRRMCADAEAAGAVAVMVDARSTTPSPGAFLGAIARELGLPADDDPIPALQEAPRLLLAVDTFEQCAVLQGWLRSEFLPRLPADAITVLAGREPPEAVWRFDPAWQDLLRIVAVRNLPPHDAAALLAARGVPEAAQAGLLAFAGGHPLALCLLAELAQRGESPELSEGDTPDVVRTLLERFVDEAPSPRHRAALEVCAHARVTTESLLRSVLDDPAAGELFAWLGGRSFVEHGAEGLYPHDLARDVLDAELRWRDPDRYADLHRRVREYLVHRMEGPDGDAARYWRDSMFLHRRNPVFAPFLSWQVESGVYGDTARPGDRPAVLAMAAAAEGSESAAIVERWLDRCPDGLWIWRRAGEPAPAGFALRLRLHAPLPADLAADPVVAAVWAHVGPLRPGEYVKVLRTFVVPGAYHRPSPVMDQIQVRCALEWTTPPAPAVSVLVLADPEFWAPQMAYIEHHRAGTATVGGRAFTLFAHDWRAMPVPVWFRTLADRELAAGPVPGPAALPPQRAVLSEPEFEAAVRDALRCWRRPDDLARNPLCRSRLVAEAPCGSGPARALADLLVEATDTLAADPRDAKLHRAVATTFFRGVPTQEAAAERLGLPFSSYRRHLTAGVTRVTAWLWQRELHGHEQEVSTVRSVG